LDLALFFGAAAVAWYAVGYVNNIYPNWGWIVGIVVFLVEMSIVAFLRDWG